MIFVSGSAFFVDGTGHDTIRLAFSAAPKSQIDEGVAAARARRRSSRAGAPVTTPVGRRSRVSGLPGSVNSGCGALSLNISDSARSPKARPSFSTTATATVRGTSVSLTSGVPYTSPGRSNVPWGLPVSGANADSDGIRPATTTLPSSASGAATARVPPSRFHR